MSVQLARVEQRGDELQVSRVDVRAVLDQQLHDVQVVGLDSQVEARGGARSVALDDVVDFYQWKMRSDLNFFKIFFSS